MSFRYAQDYRVISENHHWMSFLNFDFSTHNTLLQVLCWTFHPHTFMNSCYYYKKNVGIILLSTIQNLKISDTQHSLTRRRWKNYNTIFTSLLIFTKSKLLNVQIFMGSRYNCCLHPDPNGPLFGRRSNHQTVAVLWTDKQIMCMLQFARSWTQADQVL